MKLDYLKEKKELLPFVLLGVSVLLAVLTLVKVRSFFATSTWAQGIVQKAVKQGTADSNALDESLADSKKLAEGLRRNLFAPPVPKRNPVSTVLGILGNEALINGKWYKAGDMIGDAKILVIEPTQVRIEWEGNEKVYAPIVAAASAAPGGPGRPGGPRPGGGRPEGPGMAPAWPGGRPMLEGGMMGMRERFENMSEEERQAFRERMRERFGGRGPGMGGGRPGGDMGGGRPGGDRGGDGRRPGGGSGRGPGGGGSRR